MRVMLTIYGTQSCTYCQQAKNVADSYGIKYEYVDVHEGDNLALFKDKFPNVKKVPQIVWNDIHIGGFTEFVKEVEDTRNYGDGSV